MSEAEKWDEAQVRAWHQGQQFEARLANVANVAKAAQETAQGAGAGRLEGIGRSRGIGWAVQELYAGMKVRRRGWNGRGMFLILATQSDALTGDGRYLVGAHVLIQPVSGVCIPWLCSQADLLAADWEHANKG